MLKEDSLMYKPERMYQINRSDMAVLTYKRIAANYIDGSLLRAILFYTTTAGMLCLIYGFASFILGGEHTGNFLVLFLAYYWLKSTNIKNKLMEFKGYTYKR